MNGASAFSSLAAAAQLLGRLAAQRSIGIGSLAASASGSCATVAAGPALWHQQTYAYAAASSSAQARQAGSLVTLPMASPSAPPLAADLAALRTEAGPLATAPGPGPLTVQYPFALGPLLSDREAVVYSLESSSGGGAPEPSSILALPGGAFNVPVRLDILHRNVRYLRAKWQQGTHKAKRRDEVRGGGIKPRPQKKTGQSRQGSIRSPLWVGGGAVHGPIPRSHAHELPRAVQLLGLKSALSARLNEGRLFVVDALMPPALKDYVELRARLEQLTDGAQGSTWLLVDSEADDAAEAARLRKQLKCSVRMEVMTPDTITVYHILKYHRIVLSRAAAKQLSRQLMAPRRVAKPLKHAWWKRQSAAISAAEGELRAAEAS